jgi:hypothetical protein
MCWNSKVSLNTFLFSSFGIAFAYFNHVINIYELLFLFSFMSMQLVEYFTWENLNDKKINTLLSQIAAFLIFIQVPLFIQAKYNGPYKIGLIGFYILLYLLCIYKIKIDYSMTKAENGHLAWNWLDFPIFIYIIYFSFGLGILFYEKRYISFILYFIVISAIYYTYYKTKTWGSLWCWISNIIALKLIAQVFYKDMCKI